MRYTVSMPFPDRNAVIRFLRYAAVGGGTLLFDLCLLYSATSIFGVPYFLSTPGAFLIAVSINYFISRRYVFKGSERLIHHGYAYFILVALAGAAVTTLSVAALVSALHLYYLLARILVAGIIGIGNYLFNLHLNFKVAGKHQ
ncbi:MAG: GtrA family protein [Parcubacteria group bacterium]|nr:GtrA family protein [Parcubacteria group bacterium]